MTNLRIRFALLTAMLAVATLVTFSVVHAAPFEKIKIHRMGGEIAVDDASDGADLETMGGDIRVTRSHNLVHAHTMGGNIEIGSADGSVNVQTMGGNIQIASASGSVTAETMGGNVTTHIHNPIAPGMHDINLSSMGGNIELTVPKDFPMAIEVTLTWTKKNAGRYKIVDNLGLTQSTSEDWDTWHGDPRKSTYAKGRTGDGKNRVTIKTINGDITIKSE